MKTRSTLLALAIMALNATAFAQGMGDMSMKDKGTMDCSEMMKGMDMNGMDAQKCKDMMKGTAKQPSSGASAGAAGMTMHQADAVVKAVDAAAGKVTLAHEPVKSLGWPAMTMGFAVKDKALFDKLVVGQKVHVELKKEGADYVVTSVK